MICNREEAESAIASMIYPPTGRRGWGPFFAPARWGMNAAQYLEKVDELLTRIVLIEHPDALVNLDGILSVPGIDCALLAPNDLSLNMGFPGRPDHPEVLAAIRE